MPLYEYLCRDCEKPSELLIRGQEEPECPACGGTRMMKLLSVPAAPSSGAPHGTQDLPPGSCGGGCACFPGG